MLQAKNKELKLEKEAINKIKLIKKEEKEQKKQIKK